ncbi:MAG: FHA domain-containing serine/threonine-protein kinase [Planctomycetota bacterium]|nr:FHA domain-containing serine/threonine-protein kinase [Planctomycetota bacterium]
MMKQLKVSVIGGPDRGREFAFGDDQPLVIGRGSNSDTRIHDPALSRIHCRINLLDRQVVLSDCNGSSGTFVRGVRISKPQILTHGSVFKIGDSVLRIEDEQQLDAPTMSTDLTLGLQEDLVSASAPATLLSSTPAKEPTHSIRLLEGETFLRFRLDQLVSTGRNSFIFKGYDTKRDRLVAVKILKPQMAMTDTQRERFIRAMRTMLPIVHPNIVRTRKAGRKGVYCWAALDWVEGISVLKLIENIGVGGMLPWQEVWRVAVHITRALEEAGKRRIVHRNVTPSNILRRNDDRSYLLTDLILARALEHTDASALTRPGDVLGELPYMAPELLLDSSNVDERCDQYGLGATLYALLSGKPPYSAVNLADYLEKLKSFHPESPVNAQMGTDERFGDVVMRMIRMQPTTRYESPQAILRDLQRVGKLGGIEADWSDWI